MIELVLGGARSGKSAYAAQQASLTNQPVTFVATAEATDPEMATRIQRHRQDRPKNWHLQESPLTLARTLRKIPGDHCIVIDCLTLWLNNMLFHYQNVPDKLNLWNRERQEFLAELSQRAHQPIFLVSNETGLGVVPADSLSRLYVDQLGWLHQAVAQIASRVTLCVAGIPHPIKRETS